MAKPVAIDLFCGLGGWTKGFLAEGYEVIGFDVEHKPNYPGQYIERDVAKLCGYDLRSVNPTVIVASPPCQAYSYRAMPWKRAKALPPPDNTLFNACFRIAKEAGVPLVVENVKGAQPWVGRARWHYGSFYLWGDVPALMPVTRHVKVNGFNFHQHEKTGKPGGSFQSAAVKNNGGSWFNQAHNTKSGTGQNPVNGVKVPGVNWNGYGTPGYKPQGFNVTAAQRYRQEQGTKNGNDWFCSGENCSQQRRHSSRSDSRKAASAAIAEIPFDLSQWIARCFKP